ncbi:MAG: hypothetical protein LBC42_00225 [Puniceicoccales bacterium]|nr:hypothetical protein [Puniceicoccales bacterium]
MLFMHALDCIRSIVSSENNQSVLTTYQTAYGVATSVFHHATACLANVPEPASPPSPQEQRARLSHLQKTGEPFWVTLPNEIPAKMRLCIVDPHFNFDQPCYIPWGYLVPVDDHECTICPGDDLNPTRLQALTTRHTPPASCLPPTLESPPPAHDKLPLTLQAVQDAGQWLVDVFQALVAAFQALPSTPPHLPAQDQESPEVHPPTPSPNLEPGKGSEMELDSLGGT